MPSLNETPSGERIHIGFFGKRNAGKSSLLNAITGQDIAIISDIPGTTTDPVMKSMEILPLGPVVLIDTPGLDDSGELGEMRIKKARQIINRCDIAVIVTDAAAGSDDTEKELADLCKAKNLPCVTVANKCDLLPEADIAAFPSDVIAVSAKKQIGIRELKEKIGSLTNAGKNDREIVGDMIKNGDFVVLVTPIDASAPKGRLILPQQQTIRNILDHGGICVVAKDTELETVLAKLGADPAMVITDSQVFGKIMNIVPPKIPLTSFSILFARYKGLLESAIAGVKKLDNLNDGDTVLISEGCTHHRQCGDIGTVKLPRKIHEYTKKNPRFVFSSGNDFPSDLTGVKLVIHCGGCMLNEREMKYRIQCAADAGVPITNYGMAIAKMNGILERSLAPLKSKL